MIPRSINFIPKSALVSGILGLLPVVFLSAVILHQSPNVHGEIIAALPAYGAVILSFLGGVRWGTAISGTSHVPLSIQLWISVVPSLVGWAAILIEIPAALLVLTVAFSLMLFTDYMIAGAPVWYLRLRVILSLPVIACLLIVLSVQ
tara:strand:- start:65 stop:505 length:441 start_codon:yes stop_codon:yes gene_type:complete